jgi:hypothetical protein
VSTIWKVAACVVVSTLSTWAIPLYINDPTGTTNGVYTSTQRFEARLRVSDTSWDVGLGPTGTSKTGQLGTAAAILPVLWQFELLSDPTIGLRFRVKNSALPLGPWTTTLWGRTELLGGFTPFGRAFNTLRLQLTATGLASTNRNATMSNLNLYLGPGEGYRDDQGLTDLTVTRTTPSSTFSNFPSDPLGNDSHWVYSSANLAAQAWRLTGRVDFNSLSGNPGNALKLSIFGSQYTFTDLPDFPAEPVPEPGACLLTGAAMGAGLWWRRRRAARKLLSRGG